MTLTVAAEIHSACTAIILLQELSQPILKMHTGSSLSRKIRSTSSVASAANGRYLIARLLSDESAGLITPDSSQDDIGRDVQNCSLSRKLTPTPANQDIWRQKTASIVTNGFTLRHTSADGRMLRLLNDTMRGPSAHGRTASAKLQVPSPRNWPVEQTRLAR